MYEIIIVAQDWKSTSLNLNKSGKFDIIITTWWGLSKDIKTYSFDNKTHKWKMLAGENSRPIDL